MYRTMVVKPGPLGAAADICAAGSIAAPAPEPCLIDRLATWQSLVWRGITGNIARMSRRGEGYKPSGKLCPRQFWPQGSRGSSIRIEHVAVIELQRGILPFLAQKA